MKKLILISAAVAALLPTQSFAQMDNSDFDNMVMEERIRKIERQQDEMERQEKMDRFNEYVQEQKQQQQQQNNNFNNNPWRR